MKVAFAQNNVLGSSGLQETKGFEIRTTGHAFRILSSGLYSDKVRAVLREIGCNASDAHIAAGCPERQFRVKLPNILDDQFYVQDWGPGLSHEEVMSLYTTYFASTKQSSNDYTGAFGLGSKSPFSYTDSFAVVSSHGGRKRTYSLYINNEGSPEVSLMADEDAEPDWPTGIRVTFAVKPEDFEPFKEKAQAVFQWFKVPPEIRGAPPIVPIQYRSDREDFRLQQSGGDPTVLMGNVAYPLDFKQCGVIEPYNSNASTLRNYATCTRGFVLVLPIGSVQVAASREALQYDPHSVKALQERIDLSMRRLGADVVSSLEAASTGGWSELCKSRDLVEQGMPGTLRYDFDAFSKALGIDRAVYERLKPFINKDPIALPKEAGAKAACRLVKVKKYGKGQGRPQSSWIAHGTSQLGGEAKLDVVLETVIAAGNCGYAVPRARKAVAEGKYAQVLVFAKPSDSKLSDFEIHEEAREVSRLLGGVEVIDLQSLEAPPVTPGKKRKPKGWKPSLPVGQTFTCYRMENKKDEELASLPDQLFACYVRKSRWGNVSQHYRMYKTDDKTDRRMEWDSWKEAWAHYGLLQAAVGLDKAPSSHAILKASDIRSLRIVELGWRPAHEALTEYIARSDLKRALKKLIKRKHIMAPEEGDFNYNKWMSSLSWLALQDKLPRAVEARLQELDLSSTVASMVKARKAHGEGEPDVPAEIGHYTRLVEQFGMTNELAEDVRTALTVEDVDAAFVKRFPRASYMHISNLGQAKDLKDMLLFILGRES